MHGSLHIDLLGQLLPEAALVVTAVLVLFLDLGRFRNLPLAVRMRRGGGVAATGLVAAWALLQATIANGDAPAATFLLQPGTQFLKGVLVLLSLATVLLSIPGRFTRHAGEFFALLLLATVGLLLLIGTGNLLMLFVALELVSLSLYVLTALHDESPSATEAALKYFLIGGLAAAVTLFGMSLLYGLTGSLQLGVIGSRLAAAPRDPLLWMAIVMTVSGVAFKIAVAPFHLWAPDVYQGAPTPTAALIASGSKIAGFVLLVRIAHTGFGPATAGSASGLHWTPGWVPVLAVLATLSMIVGNLAALQQTDLRRLLAYSAVAQAGYGILGVLDPAPDSRATVLYFAVTYAVAVLGAFGVIATLEAAGGDGSVSGLAGLARRSPFLAACLTVFVLSLAGIPPLAGFFGKFFVFVHAVSAGTQIGRLWLVGLAVATSAVALFYYLQILKQALLIPPDPGSSSPISPPMLSVVALGLLAAATLVLGCAPALLLNPLR